MDQTLYHMMSQAKIQPMGDIYKATIDGSALDEYWVPRNSPEIMVELGIHSNLHYKGIEGSLEIRPGSDFKAGLYMPKIKSLKEILDNRGFEVGNESDQWGRMLGYQEGPAFNVEDLVKIAKLFP